jgi:prevent-host-death family protein
MQTEAIGVREFREKLADYLEGGRPLAITRHGRTLGYFIPARKQDHKAKLAALRAVAKDLDAMIASWGASEEELMEEYQALRDETRVSNRPTS